MKAKTYQSMSVGQHVAIKNAPLVERVKYHLTGGRYGALKQVVPIVRLPGQIHSINVEFVVTDYDDKN